MSLAPSVQPSSEGSCHLDFRAILLEGELGGVAVGQTRAQVMDAFVRPDSMTDFGGGISIWQFGTLEFHFDGDELYMVWCDGLDESFGSSVVFDPWILKDRAGRDWHSVLSVLAQEHADLQIGYQKYQTPAAVLVYVNRSAVTLWFEADEHSPSGRVLNAFGLTHADYDTRFRRQVSGGDLH